MKTLLLITAALFLQFPAASSAPSAWNEPLPHYDKRTITPSKSALRYPSITSQAEAALVDRVPEARVSRDRVLGTPRLVTATRGFLTGPQGEGSAISRNSLLAISPADPHRVIKAFINEHSALFGHDSSLLASAAVTTDAVSSHNGLRTVIWHQRHLDIPVFEGLLAGHITRAGELVSLSARFVPDPATASERSAALPAEVIPLSAALVAAAANTGAGVDLQTLAWVRESQGPDLQQVVRMEGLVGPAWARLVWLPMSRESMRLCWQIVFNTRPAGHRYLVLVDARNAEVLVRRNLTVRARPATYEVFASDSPSPFTPGHPVPLRTQPPSVGRTSITWVAQDTNASPQGWIPEAGLTTSGNNGIAFADRDLGFDPDGPLPNGGPNRNFSFPLDLANDPRTYANASAAQLFYRVNWFHDRTYQLGFTESFGNFQVNNFGRGGIGGDPVIGLVQAGADAGYSNNAFFQPAPDGIPGYVAMFTWTGADPDRCGSLDSEVVIHELAHGLSTRLLGGGTGIYLLQAEGLGEGWSDFYALALLSEPEDDLSGNYAPGGYVTYQFYNFTENYYYGVRRYPYSTDLSRSPLTFKDIDPTRADPHFGVSTSPIFGGGRADEVHNMGEVWCAILWEMRAAIVEQLGWAAGNEMALQLVTDGLKLAPENATFVEARDAIILADQVLTGGSQYDELWTAFAKRGLGYGAQAPPADRATGVQEAYDLPPDVIIGFPDGFLELKITPAPGSLLFAGDTNSLHVRVKDGTSITNATVTGRIGTTRMAFRNDGLAPDAFAADSTYSSSFLAPAAESSLVVEIVVSAPGKTNATNIVSYTLIPVPRNDHFLGAVKVPSPGTNFLTSNKKATMEPGEPRHAGISDSAASLWWNYVPAGNGEVLIDTGGSDFPTIIGVYTNSALTNLQPVASAVGSSTGGRKGAYLKFNGRAGVTYRIATASTDPRFTGALRLRIAAGGQPDLVNPVVTISSPTSGIVVTTNRLLLTGSAVDIEPNASGVLQINIGVSTTPGFDESAGVTTTVYPSQQFNGPVSSNWVAMIGLRSGLNHITVAALDYAGNKSSTIKIQVLYRVLEPVNDFFVNRIGMTNATDTYSVNTLRATRELGEPNHAGVLGGKSAWWSFTAPTDGVLSLSTSNSLFDTVLAVYTGDRVNALTPVGANDDAAPGSGFSALEQPVEAGVAYQVAVDGYDETSGVVFLEYAFVPANLCRVTLSAGNGGTVSPASMNVQSNSVLLVTASPDEYYRFAGWEGSFASADNPLKLTVRSNLTLSARFAPVEFTEGFESGTLTALPWVTGPVPWTVQTNRVSAGRWAARSGVIGNNETTSFSLRTDVKEGIVSFSYRVSSEKGWDRLTFLLDNNPVQHWTGELDWSNFAYPVTAGRRTFEWRYSKDNLNAVGEDAAFIDNINLPLSTAIDPSIPVRLSLSPPIGGLFHIDLTGQAGIEYILETSADMKAWTGVKTNIAVDGKTRFTEPVSPSTTVRYYRARTR